MSDVVLFEAFVTSAARSDSFPMGAAPAVPSGWLYPDFQTRAVCLVDCQQAGATRASHSWRVWGCCARAGDWCLSQGVVFPKHEGVHSLQRSAGIPSPGCSPGVGSAQILYGCGILGFPQPPKFALISAPP